VQQADVLQRRHVRGAEGLVAHGDGVVGLDDVGEDALDARGAREPLRPAT
jgi:hypothetical protein